MGGDKSRTGRRGVTLMTGQRSAFRHFSEFFFAVGKFAKTRAGSRAFERRLRVKGSHGPGRGGARKSIRVTTERRRTFFDRAAVLRFESGGSPGDHRDT